MMKVAVLVALVACAITYGPQATHGTNHPAPDSGAPDTFNCNVPSNDEIGNTLCFSSKCTSSIAGQIKRELEAAFTYLYMAALFDDNRIARPGMAKILYESASEERQHAIMMMDYLNSRGVFYDQTFAFSAAEQGPLDEISKEPTLLGALTTALNLEVKVTKHIHDVVKDCSDDFHGADFFTDPILEEQHEGIRKLQGAINAFQDLLGPSTTVDDSAEALAEFIFDKKLLAEGL